MSDISTALKFVPFAVLSIMAISNPISTSTMFLTLTDSMPNERKLVTAARSAQYSLGILLFFAISGMLVFQIFGLGIGAFRIAGGILLLITAIGLLHPKEEEAILDDPARDIALIPMSMPFISGPGTMVTVVVPSSCPPLGIWVRTISAPVS